MRTTLTIDDDVLDAARDLAVARGRPVGEVLTELARRGLQRRESPAETAKTRNGIPLLASRPVTTPVTSALVNELRDDLP